MTDPSAPRPPDQGTRGSAPVQVVLCDEAGRPTGVATRDGVHGADTPLHLAFSLHLLDDEGRTLLTRRALGKLTWPGVWTNSCCGHPGPGERTEDAVRRRVREELGCDITDLRLVLPDFRYRAVDVSGVVEHEICPVFVARVSPGDIRPDPREVAETAWVAWPDAVRQARTAPATLSPWSVLQLDAMGEHVAAAADVPTPEATAEAVEALLTTTARSLQERWAAGLPAGDLGPGVDEVGRWAAEAVLAGGKRIRPRMCHWGFVAAGGVADATHEDAVRAAAALEVLHAFALVQDDVMDRSTTRRGTPAVHVRAAATSDAPDAARFGDSMAVLVGDLLHAEADRIAGWLPDAVHEEWWALTLELVAGQCLDLAGSATDACPLTHAQDVADLKSGAYTVRRPLRLGALAAGADTDTLAALDRYAGHAGRAFALRDDLLGLWGDPRLTGKPAGDDLREAKPTVVRALTQQRLDPDDQAVIARAAHPDADDALVADALATVEARGIRASVEAMVIEQTQAALDALADPAIAPPAREGLAALTRRIAWRQS